jgi:hypothetical protein
LLPATLTIFHGAGNNADHFSALWKLSPLWAMQNKNIFCEPLSTFKGKVFQNKRGILILIPNSFQKMCWTQLFLNKFFLST